MIGNPLYVEVNGKRYKINTNFKVALKCNDVAQDNSIGDYEKMVAIIYLIFGDEGLKDRNNYVKLINLALDYLSCGEKLEDVDEIDMDFIQDYRYIRASFMSDYGIDIEKEDLHWYDFNTYLNGLKEDCILNRIRMLRTYDTSEITNMKDKSKIEKAKKRVALKKKEIELTKEQLESINRLDEIIGRR